MHKNKRVWAMKASDEAVLEWSNWLCTAASHSTAVAAEAGESYVKHGTAALTELRLPRRDSTNVSLLLTTINTTKS